MAGDRVKLLDDINAGLQAYAAEEIRFPVAEELPPLAPNRVVTWKNRLIEPPGLVYLSRDDYLRVTAWSHWTGATCHVSGRYLLESGEIIRFGEQFTPPSNITATSIDIRLPEGFLMSLALHVHNATPERGAFYATAAIMVGNPVDDIESTVLIADYLSAASPRGWPYSPMVHPLEGRGTLISGSLVTDGAGPDIIYEVPAGLSVDLHALKITLVTDATVANRRVTVVIERPGAEFWRHNAQVTQAASLTRRYYYGFGAVSDSAGAVINYNYSLPPMRLREGYRIKTEVVNLQAGDDLLNSTIFYEELLNI